MSYGRITNEQFITVWQNSQSRIEVSDKLGITPNSCGQRASKLRKLGIELKKFESGRPKGLVDPKKITELKKLANNI